MRTLNPEHLKEVITMVNQSEFFRLLEITVVDIGIGYSVLEMNIDTKHMNPFGGVHGGGYAALADCTGYWAIYGDLDENIGLTTLDLYVNNLTATKTSKIIAKGRRIKTGKTICMAEVCIYDENGVLLCEGSSKLFAKAGLQTIFHASKYLNAPLHYPKFLD